MKEKKILQIWNASCMCIAGPYSLVYLIYITYVQIFSSSTILFEFNLAAKQ